MLATNSTIRHTMRNSVALGTSLVVKGLRWGLVGSQVQEIQQIENCGWGYCPIISSYCCILDDLAKRETFVFGTSLSSCLGALMGSPGIASVLDD